MGRLFKKALVADLDGMPTQHTRLGIPFLKERRQPFAQPEDAGDGAEQKRPNRHSSDAACPPLRSANKRHEDADSGCDQMQIAPMSLLLIRAALDVELQGVQIALLQIKGYLC